MEAKGIMIAASGVICFSFGLWAVFWGKRPYGNRFEYWRGLIVGGLGVFATPIGFIATLAGLTDGY